MVSVGLPVPNAASPLFPSDSLIAHILDYALPTPALTPVGLNMLEALTANDNAIWVGNDDGDGALGTEVAGTHLPGIGTVVAWIGEDRIIHAKLVSADVNIDGSAVPVGPEKQRLDDSMLASLGSAGLANGQGSGRLAVVATAKNTFTALWVADFGFTAALMGKAFTFAEPTQRQEAESHGTATPDFTALHLPPVRITGSVQSFDVTVSAAGETVIDVEVTTEAGDIEMSSFALAFNNGEAELKATKVNDASDSAQPQSIAVVSNLAPATNGDATNATGTDSAGLEDDTDVSVALVPASSTASPLLFGGLNQPPTAGFDGVDGTISGQPESHSPALIPTLVRLPVALSSGGSAALNFEPGNSAGTGRLTVEITPANNATTDQPSTVVVADNVILQDAGRPDLDVAPVLFSTGDDIAVSWVAAEEPAGGDATVRSLNVGIITPPSSFPSDDEPVLEIVTLLTTTEPISDIDLAGQDTPGASPQWTVAWVQNANIDGYGSLNLRNILKDFEDGDGKVSDHNSLTASKSEQGGLDGTVAPSPAASLAGPSVGETVSEIAASNLTLGVTPDVAPDTSNSGYSHWIGAKSGRLLDERARAPDVSVVAEGALAVSWLSQGTPDDPGNTVHIMLLSNELETVHRFDLNTQISGRIGGTYGPQIVTNGDGEFLVGWLREADGDGYEAVAVTLHYAADLGWIMQPQPAVIATFEDDPKDLQFRSLEKLGETQIVLQWKDSGDTHQHILDFDGLDFGGEALNAAEPADGAATANDMPTTALEAEIKSDNRGGQDSDDPIATTVAVTIDENSDVIIFSDTSETAVALLKASDISLSSSEFGAAVAALSALPAVGHEGPQTTAELEWNEAQSIDDIIGAMGEHIVLSTEALASGSTFELTAGNDNSDAIDSNETVEIAFDALQFANILNASANADVMTFDAAGFVQLKDFDPI